MKDLNCQPGYVQVGTKCVDINECVENKDDCSEHSRCDNTEGSFNCICKTGFKKEGNVCKNINECDANTYTCHQFAFCKDTIGSYTCECEPGFTGTGKECEGLYIYSTVTVAALRCELRYFFVSTESVYFATHENDNYKC